MIIIINKEIQLNLYLDDIQEYINSTLIYLTDRNGGLDKNELIMYLSTVPEKINECKNIIQELIKN